MPIVVIIFFFFFVKLYRKCLFHLGSMQYDLFAEHVPLQWSPKWSLKFFTQKYSSQIFVTYCNIKTWSCLQFVHNKYFFTFDLAFLFSSVITEDKLLTLVKKLFSEGVCSWYCDYASQLCLSKTLPKKLPKKSLYLKISLHQMKKIAGWQTS